MEHAVLVGPGRDPKPAKTTGKHNKSSVSHLFWQQVIINFVVVGVLIVAGAFLVFKVQGEAYTQLTAAGFIATCFLSFIIFLPAGTLFACRTEVAKGLVTVADTETTGATQPLANPVTQTIPAGIALGVICTAIACLLIYGTGWTPSPVATTLIALLFVVPYACIVRREIFRDVEGLIAAGPMHGAKVPSRTGHVWMNYILPNIVFQAIINMPLADRGFGNIAAMIGPDMVPVAALVPDSPSPSCSSATLLSSAWSLIPRPTCTKAASAIPAAATASTAGFTSS